MPYTQKLAQHFGGAWVHYCGRNDALTRMICEIPEIRGINFGLIPGHELDHQFEEDMKVVSENKKVYTGNWPRFENESGEDYLRRLHYWASQGALLEHGDAAIGTSSADLKTVDAALDFWYAL